MNGPHTTRQEPEMSDEDNSSEETVVMRRLPQELIARVQTSSRQRATSGPPAGPPTGTLPAATQARSAPSARALHWASMLDRWTQEELDMRHALLRALPLPGLGLGPEGTFLEVLQELTGIEHEIRLEGLEVHTAQTPLTLDDTFMTRMTLPPYHTPIGVGISASLVDAWVGAMLADEDYMPRLRSPLDERTFGLMTYLGMRVVDAMHQAHGTPPVLMAASAPNRDDLRRALFRSFEVDTQEERVVEIVFLVMATRAAGFVRLFIPETLLSALQAAGQRRVDVPFEAVRGALSKVQAEVPVVMGRVEVTRAEYAELGRGDVVFVSSHGVTGAGLEPGGGGARVELAPGVAWPVTLRAEGRAWQVEVLENRPSKETKMDEAVASGVESVELSLDVRIGHLSMSVGELQALQVGQILKLGVEVGVGVELVSGAQVIATGELVDVEGHLGVQITNKMR